jgi:EAL domain-containing protein (putative c-di-GMP-specific phosphodiesterase class I)
MSMVVEGVEDAATLASLREWGCDVAQGYYIARPMPGDSVLPWLSTAGGAGTTVAVPRPRTALSARPS